MVHPLVETFPYGGHESTTDVLSKGASDPASR